MNAAPDPSASPSHGRVFLVDGSGFIFRAYHSMPPLTNPEGTPVGAVYGFTNMLVKLIDDITADADDGDAIAVLFDAKRETFRNQIYPDYKGNRPDAPEDLIPQFPLIRDATRAFGLPAIEMEGYEADDLIATYTKQAQAQGREVIIVSSDKDLMQLIGDGVTMFDVMKNRRIDVAEVEAKFGVGPDKVVDAQALIGDSSDNVPGVPGIGPKTAAELIHTYGSLDALLERAEEITQKKRRENLIAFADQARMSRELVTLQCGVDVPQTLASLTYTLPDVTPMLAFLEQQGFKSLLSRMRERYVQDGAAAPGKSGTEAPAVTSSAAPGSANYHLIQDEADLKAWIARAMEAGAVAFDTETTSLDAMSAEIVGFSMCIAPGEACYVPVGHVTPQEQASLLVDEDPEMPEQIAFDTALALLKPLLEDPAVLKIGQNIKYDMLVLRKYGLRCTPVEDTMCLSYVLDAGLHGHGMDALSRLHLGVTPIPYKELTGTGKKQISFAQVPLQKATDYAAEDADITQRLHRLLKPRLIAEHLVSVYETLERPLIPVLVAMEEAGVKIDVARLKTLSDDFARRMADLEAQIHTEAKHPFNVGSTQQLGVVLFEEMGLQGGRKGKSGAYSTDAEMLEKLSAEGVEIARLVLEWRQLSKLKSTYTDKLPTQIHPQTGRVHTSYGMTIATTGRLSSTDPNLQNIPIRSEDGRKIRDAFVAEKGMRFISADYSQIELRLLADIADITVLKEAFREGRDIHAITASQMFGCSIDAVDSELRRKAKTINFGIIYGISPHGLAARLGISRSEAKEYIDRYFAQYPGIRAYMDRTIQTAREQGYVTTLYGRKIHTPQINDKNPARRNFAERAAINAPLQGTAADIIKRAMIRVYHALRDSNVEAAMLLSVHDEIILEAAEKDVEATQALVVSHMEAAAHLSVPLTVEANAGANWGEVH